MHKRYQDIYDKIVKLIKSKGIPYYIKKWKKCNMKEHYKTEEEFKDELIECVQKYHHHTSLYYKGNWIQSKKHIQEGKRSLKRYKYIIELRKLPYMKLDKDKIGIIRFYQYVDPVNMNNGKKEWMKFGKIIRNKIRDWQKKGMKGLILDFRYFYGGNVFPLYYAFSDILEDSTIYGWSNKKANKDDKVWINVKKGKILHGQKYLSDRLNINIPVAIVVGNDTASSGEFGALIFYGRKNVKFFGQRTSGNLSGNMLIKLNKDITICLTCSLVNTVDGTFHIKEYIDPDIETNTPIIDAKKWIKSC